MKREIYAGIAIAGLVFAFLSNFVNDEAELAVTILLATAYLLGYLYLFDEFRYYREHNALLASLQFLLIPIILLILGNILAPIGYEAGFIEFNIDFIISIDAQSSYASILLLVSTISILRLTSRYYDARYPGFVIGRTQFGNFKFPFLIHLIAITLVIMTSMWLELIDLVALLFVIASVIQLVQKLIIPPIRNSVTESNRSRGRRRNLSSDPDRRSFLDSVTGRGSSRRRNSSSRSRPSPTRSSNSTNRSRSRSRDISTAPSDGYREIPTRSRNSTSPSNTSPSTRSRSSSSPSSRSRPTPSRSAATVDKGIDVVSRTKTRKVKKSKITDYLPKGNYDSSDLQCIVCYDNFSESSNQNIVVCPMCKFPGHEVELLSWLNTSSRCPRCNKEITNKRALRSGTVSEAQYAKFIRKL